MAAGSVDLYSALDGLNAAGPEIIQVKGNEAGPLHAAMESFEPLAPPFSEGNLVMTKDGDFSLTKPKVCDTRILTEGLNLKLDDLRTYLATYDQAKITLFLGGSKDDRLANSWWNEELEFTHMDAKRTTIIPDTIPESEDSLLYAVSNNDGPKLNKPERPGVPGLSYQLGQGFADNPWTDPKEVATLVTAASELGDNHSEIFFLWASRLMASMHYEQRASVTDINIKQEKIFKQFFPPPKGTGTRASSIVTALQAGELLYVIPPECSTEESLTLIALTCQVTWASGTSTSHWAIHGPQGYATKFKWCTLSHYQDNEILGGTSPGTIQPGIVVSAIEKYLNFHNLHDQFERISHIIALGPLTGWHLSLPPSFHGAEAALGRYRTTRSIDMDNRDPTLELSVLKIVKETIDQGFGDMFLYEIEKHGLITMDKMMNIASALCDKFQQSEFESYYGGIMEYLYGINLFEISLLVQGTLSVGIRQFFISALQSNDPIPFAGMLATGYKPKSELFRAVMSEGSRMQLASKSRVTTRELMILANLCHNETDRSKLVPLIRYNVYRAEVGNGLHAKRATLGDHVGERNLKEIKGDIIVKYCRYDYWAQGTDMTTSIPKLYDYLVGLTTSVNYIPTISLPDGLGEPVETDYLKEGEDRCNAGIMNNSAQFRVAGGLPNRPLPPTNMEVGFVQEIDVNQLLIDAGLDPHDYGKERRPEPFPSPYDDTPTTEVKANEVITGPTSPEGTSKVVSPPKEDSAPTQVLPEFTSIHTSRTGAAFVNDKTEYIDTSQELALTGPEEWRQARRLIPKLLPAAEKLVELTKDYGYNQSIPVGKAVHEVAREEFSRDNSEPVDVMYLQALAGRPDPNSSIDADIESRVNSELTAKEIDRHIFDMSDAEISESISRCLSREIIRLPPKNKETFKEFYQRRHEWMRSGSAFTMLDTTLEKGAPKTKRTLMEHVKYEDIVAHMAENPIHIAKSHLKGNENGKIRPILASTYEHYVIGSYICSKLEDGLVFRHSPMNKGPRQLLKETKNREQSCREGKWIACLDYTDFNSQHNSYEQSSVLMELLEYSYYKDDLEFASIVEWYSLSLHNQWILHEGTLRRAAKGLFSGVRATSLINTVLNLTYHHEYVSRLRQMDPSYDIVDHYNFGDDGWVEATTEREAISYCRIAQISGSQINPSKQMIKHGAGEFLRVMYNQLGSYACPMRSIANLAFGNIESNQKPIKGDKLTSLYNKLATVCRSGCDHDNATDFLLSEGRYLLGDPDQEATNEQVYDFLFGKGNNLPIDGSIPYNGELLEYDKPSNYRQVEYDYEQTHSYATDDYIDYIQTKDKVKVVDIGGFREKLLRKNQNKVSERDSSGTTYHHVPRPKYVNYDFTNTGRNIRKSLLAKIRKWQDLKSYIDKDDYNLKMNNIAQELGITREQLLNLSQDTISTRVAGDWFRLDPLGCNDPLLQSDVNSLWNNYNVDIDGYEISSYSTLEDNDLVYQLMATMMQ